MFSITSSSPATLLNHALSSSSARLRRSAKASSSTATTTQAMTTTQQKDNTTIEYQRTKAKEMVKYFKEQQYQQLVEDSTVFGFTKKNEINNGRWTMFGLLVGMMTEYATGVDFIDQIKLLVNVLGIADLD
jgi:two-component SAPR family response regulator